MLLNLRSWQKTSRKFTRLTSVQSGMSGLPWESFSLAYAAATIWHPSKVRIRPTADITQIESVALEGRGNLFPLQSKNLRRLAQVRSILYIVMAIVGFVLLGVSMLRKH
jgi:hypothetical protein